MAIQKEERGTQIVITGATPVRWFLRTREERFRMEMPVDLVSIDGKPYYVPRSFFAFGPTEVGENAVVQGGITPSVNYVRLDSGVYVSVDYVSDSVMKRLEELNGEYLTFSLMSRLQCEEKCDNFDDFSKVYRKKFITAIEQVRLLAADLRSKGFRFNAKGDNTVLVEVVGPDGDDGYSRINKFIHSACYRGKRPVLGPVYSFADL